ncbi:hypothetical protein QM565_36265 [Geitlerinema splendidum]|nr:hypothetical protein [Geitlerinema splendidum]
MALMIFVIPGLISTVLATLVLNIFGVFLNTWNNLAQVGVSAAIFGAFCLLALTKLGVKNAFIIQSVLGMLYVVFIAIDQGVDDLPYMWQPLLFLAIAVTINYYVTRYILKHANPDIVSSSWSQSSL